MEQFSEVKGAFVRVRWLKTLLAKDIDPILGGVFGQNQATVKFEIAWNGAIFNNKSGCKPRDNYRTPITPVAPSKGDYALAVCTFYLQIDVVALQK